MWWTKYVNIINDVIKRYNLGYSVKVMPHCSPIRWTVESKAIASYIA